MDGAAQRHLNSVSWMIPFRRSAGNERLAADPLDDQAKQLVAGVRMVKARARRQRRLKGPMHCHGACFETALRASSG